MAAIVHIPALEISNGETLTRAEQIVLELVRTGRSDAYMRGLLAMSQGGLERVAARLRGKLAIGIDESIRDAADRLGVPRLDLGR